MPVSRVGVRVLGGFTVEGIDSARLGSRKARTVLKRLALARGRPVSVDALVDTVWPGEQPAEPTKQLSVLVSRLRRVLGTDRLPRVDGGYSLRMDWLDLDALRERVDEVERRVAAGTPATARAAAAAAVELIRGDLLPDEDPGAEWLAAERSAAVELVQRARLAAGRAALIAGDAWRAAEVARAALAVELYDEAAIRLLMSALVASGRPAVALTAYDEFASRLRDELGVDPADDTEADYLAILRGEAQPASGAGAKPSVVLVGRNAEVAALDQELAKVRSASRLVSVEGEGGIGKTRLIESWTAGLREQGTVILGDRAGAHGRSAPAVDRGRGTGAPAPSRSGPGRCAARR